MSTKTCLDHIIELKQKIRDDSKWKQAVNVEFSNKGIMADWGAKKNYTVVGVDFEKNPMTTTFMKDSQEINLAEYFEKIYEKKIKNLGQPLLVVKANGMSNYLPPEFCLFSNVPESIRKGPNMRNALKQAKIEPEERLRKIKEMAKVLQDMKTAKNWGFEIDETSVSLNVNVLEKA